MEGINYEEFEYSEEDLELTRDFNEMIYIYMICYSYFICLI